MVSQLSTSESYLEWIMEHALRMGANSSVFLCKQTSYEVDISVINLVDTLYGKFVSSSCKNSNRAIKYDVVTNGQMEPMKDLGWHTKLATCIQIQFRGRGMGQQFSRGSHVIMALYIGITERLGHKYFIIQTVHRCYPAKHFLKKFKDDININYSFCTAQPETIPHLLFHCQYTKNTERYNLWRKRILIYKKKKNLILVIDFVALKEIPETLVHRISLRKIL